MQTQAVITAMDAPIGRAVGNANEVVECIELLKGSGSPDLVENALELSERMLVAAGVANDRAEAASLCRRAIDSGQALERLRAIIERQGGDPRVIDDYSRMPQAPQSTSSARRPTASSPGSTRGSSAGRQWYWAPAVTK